MRSALAKLGRRMGLTTSLVSYCLRRGAAFLLAANCTEEERCARMGHKTGDKTYWTHYRNETSTIDFQAIRAGVDAEDVTVLSSILLASRQSAPTSISSQGFRDVYKDPKLKALLSKEADLLDDLLTQNLSLDAAKVKEPRKHKRLEDLSSEILALKVKLRAQIYRAEYKAYVEKPCEIAIPGDDEKTPLLTTVAHLPGGSEAPAGNDVQVTEEPWEKDARGYDEIFLQSLNPSGVDGTSAVATGLSEVSNEYGDLFNNIDPTLLEEDATHNMDRFFDATADEDNDAVGEDNAVDDYLFEERRIKQFGQAKTMIAPWTIADDVPAMMFGLGSQLEIELGASMVDFFNHLHPIDSFYPGQEPLTGTLSCRFCHQPMTQSTGPTHARSCAKDAITKTTQWALETQFPILEQCSWLLNSGPRCRQNQFSTYAQVARHIYNHWYRGKDQGPDSCRLSPCDQDVEPVIFRAHVTFMQHMITVHGIPSTSSTAPGAVTPYIHWCGLCGRWVSQLLEDLDDHNAKHEQLIGEIIRTEGFTGVTLRFVTIRPPLNPFDVYDTSLQPSARFKLSYLYHQDVGEAIESHIAKLDDNGRFLCPASVDAGHYIKAACSQHALMSKDQLRSHMTEAHGIRPRDKDKEAEEAKEAKNKAKDAKANGVRKNKEAPEASSVDDGVRGSKRLKGSRRMIGSLQPKYLDAAVGASMKSNASML